MIYHIRYTPTHLPTARLVLGTMRATPFGIGKSHCAPLSAFGTVPQFRTIPHLAWRRILAHTTAPWHCSIHPPTVLHVQHDHDDHQHLAPPLN
jgi:hypothetical protein